MKHIMLGYDATPAADHALERTAEFAQMFGAKVTVASIARPLLPAGKGVGPIDPVDPPSLHEQEAAEAQKRLAELGVEADTVVGIGDPGKVIAHLAEQRHADLIVVGSHRGPGLRRVFTGSVGDAVRHKASCDVLAVR